MTPLRVLLLPSLPYASLAKAAAAGDGPRPMMEAELREHGVIVDSLDPGTGWTNPFGRMHPFYRAFDPLRTLRVLAMRRNYDLVVSGNDGAAVALLTARELFRFRTPIVIWDLSPATRWRFRTAAQDRVIPRMHGVIAVNDIQVPYIAARWGPRVAVRFVPHWVDTSFYAPGPAAPDGPVLAVGDDSGRDYPTLLRALDGLDTPAAIRTGLPLALTAGHTAVTLLRDRLTPRAFRDLYAASRFIVVPLHPDTTNASGNSALLEAASMGKAVVVSDSDGVRGFVRHEETGLIVPAGDPAALRAAIVRLAGDPGLCARLGAAARQLVERTASPAIFAGRLAVAFRDLAGR